MTRFLIPALAGALLITAAAPVLAGDDWLERNRLNVPADQWLSPGEVIDKLQTKGYKVLEIESDDGAYEVEMLDKNGVKIDAHVHPVTAELLVGYDD